MDRTSASGANSLHFYSRNIQMFVSLRKEMEPVVIKLQDLVAPSRIKMNS